MKDLPVFITEALKKIAKDEGLLDYKIEFEAGSNHGDNFLGITTAVDLHGSSLIDGKIVPKTLRLFCKSAPTNLERRNLFNTVEIFKREVIMYTKILPEFLNFQREKGLSEDEIFHSFPKCYLAVADDVTDEYFLIMENLRSKGYEMWPKEKHITIEHARLFFRELGKFHGISVALKDQKPEVFAEMKKLNDLFLPILEKSMNGTFEYSIECAMEVVKDPENRKLISNVRKNYRRILKDCLVENAGSFSFGVVTHGDCWTNNLLFQYENSGGHETAKSMSLIDWQLSRYCSPVVDILYNLLAATNKEFRENYWKELIDLYYSSLSSIVRKLGSDSDKLFTYANLDNEFKKFGKFGIVFGLVIIQFLLTTPENLKDLDAFTETIKQNGKDVLFQNHGMDDSVKDIYSQSINDIITDMLEYGYIDTNL